MKIAPRKFVAVDWSGAVKTRRKIWIASVQGGEVRRLDCLPTRKAAALEIRLEMENEPKTVVGLDFPFSFPVWFLQSKGLSTVEEYWEAAELHGEEWLRASPFHRVGRWGENAHGEFPSRRRTDCESPHYAESPFKLVGPRQVGKGAIRGAGTLRSLKEAGASIWPFHEPRLPLVVEIFPRLFYGSVTKSNRDSRRAYLAACGATLSAEQRRDAEKSDDAFDALVSALGLATCSAGLSAMSWPQVEYRLEGRIWGPESR